MLGSSRLLEAFSSRATSVDSTSSNPAFMRRLTAILAKRGEKMVDASVDRTRRKPEERRLSTFLSGSPDAVARAKLMIASHADTILCARPIWAGHTSMFVNNLILIGTRAARCGRWRIRKGTAIGSCRFCLRSSRGSRAAKSATCPRNTACRPRECHSRMRRNDLARTLRPHPGPGACARKRRTCRGDRHFALGDHSRPWRPLRAGGLR